VLGQESKALQAAFCRWLHFGLDIPKIHKAEHTGCNLKASIKMAVLLIEMSKNCDKDDTEVNMNTVLATITLCL